MNKTSLWILTAVLSLLLFACGGSRSLMTRQVQEKVELKNIVVIPYHVIRPTRGETMVRSPLSGDMFRVGKVEPGAEEVLTGLLMEFLRDNPRFRLVPRAAVEDVLEKVMTQGAIRMGPAQVLKLGERFQAQGVLLGFIYAFRERVGRSYSVETAASVSFDLYLVESATGRVLWKASYTRTQQPFMDNVLDIEEYLQGGMRWLTAAQLARLGLKMMMDKFPYLEKGP